MMRRGSILLFSLIAMSMTVIVTGALCTYYANTAHVASYYSHERSSRRVGAARALRDAMEQIIMKRAETYIAGADGKDAAVHLNFGGQPIEDVLAMLENEVPATMEIEGETYQLKAEKDATHDTLLRVIVSHDGTEIMEALIEFENPRSLNTLDVFDYVYFVDNNGQLNSNYIIVNGEAGSNGDFNLNGATINGFLRNLGSLALSGMPSAWLQSGYNAKIAAEFKLANGDKNVVEQARPTNPSVYVENGETKSEEWPGGYEAPSGTNPTAWTETPPTPPAAVSKPGNEPTAPEKIQRATTSFKTQPLNSQFKEYNP